MKIALDTEFIEDGKTIELLSIGLVRADGAQYYAETPLAFEVSNYPDETWSPEWRKETAWVFKNVVPNLNGNISKPLKEIASEILDFAGPRPEFWAWYADYDWVALCQLYGRMVDLPAGWPMYCRDYKQLIDTTPGADVTPDDGKHNALGDARWLADQMGFRTHAHFLDSSDWGNFNVF